MKDLSGMDKEQLKKLGENIRKIRLVKGLTQVELASQVGKDQQSIQRLEGGKVNPSYLYLFEISKGLGVKVTEIVDLE